jgi:signal transduction histidine kinase
VTRGGVESVDAALGGRVAVSTGASSPAEVERHQRRFWLAAAGASVVLAIAAVLVALAPPSKPDDLLPPLVAAAGLCIGVLARRWAPTVAWLALIVASLVASSVPIAVSRSADPGTIGLGTWLVVAARSSAAATVTVAIAALYAIRPDRPSAGRLATLATFLVAWLAAACLLVAVLVIAGARYDPEFTWIDLATWPTSVFIQFVLLLTAFGVTADIRDAASRADGRLAVAARPPDRAAPTLVDRVRATARELVPGRAAAEDALIDAERVRLAGDLHAVVLPALRRAIAEVEAGGQIEALAGHLRTVDLELERLMADRWPVVLEAFGLVEALEDLAELTETEALVQIDLEVEEAGGRLRPEIERTGWRIAQIALENAVRHAAATRITIGVAVLPDRVRLSVADDGRGLDPADQARPGARGLADLVRRARAVGGSVSIDAGRPSGTVVRFDWPSSRRE